MARREAPRCEPAAGERLRRARGPHAGRNPRLHRAPDHHDGALASRRNRCRRRRRADRSGGRLESVARRLGTQRYTVDRRFEQAVLLPGFIEPHLHPYIAGILLPMHFVTPHAWSLPGREVQRVRGREAYLARLEAIERELGDGEWLWTWGYHHLYHGRIRARRSRCDLARAPGDRLAPLVPRADLEYRGARGARDRREAVGDDPQVELARGHFSNAGCSASCPHFGPTSSRCGATSAHFARRARSSTREASQRCPTARSARSTSTRRHSPCGSRAGTSGTRPSVRSCSRTAAPLAGRTVTTPRVPRSRGSGRRTREGCGSVPGP